MRTLAAVTGVAIASVTLSGCVFSTNFGSMDKFHDDFHNTFPVQAKVRIDAESFNGAIEIDGWDRNEVEISGVKSASTEAALAAIKIDMHNSPDAVAIRAIRPVDIKANMGVKITMHVPRTAEVGRATTSNGKLQVRDVAHAGRLKSSNGAVTIANVHGDIDAETSNGAIDASSLDGALALNTSNGPIRAEDVTGSLDAQTSNGAITAHLSSAPSGRIKLMSSNGPVSLSMDKAPESEIHVETGNSPITLHLPANTNARLTADTSNAPLDCDFDIVGERTKGHLRGTIGTGGHPIELSTSNGRIRIANICQH